LRKKSPHCGRNRVCCPSMDQHLVSRSSRNSLHCTPGLCFRFPASSPDRSPGARPQIFHHLEVFLAGHRIRGDTSQFHGGTSPPKTVTGRDPVIRCAPQLRHKIHPQNQGTSTSSSELVHSFKKGLHIEMQSLYRGKTADPGHWTPSLRPAFQAHGQNPKIALPSPGNPRDALPPRMLRPPSVFWCFNASDPTGGRSE
jgi:hypothetical protein